MSFPWFLRGSLDSSGFWCRGHSPPQYQHGLRRIGHCNQPEILTPALPVLRQHKYPRTTLHAPARVLAFLGFEAQITLIRPTRTQELFSSSFLLGVRVSVCCTAKAKKANSKEETAVMAEAVVDIDVGTQPFDLAFHPSASLVAVSLITGRLHLWVSLSLATYERKGKCCAPNLDAAYNLSKSLSVCISSDRGIFTVVDGITCGCKHCKPWGKIYGLIERRLVFSCSYEYGDGRQPERWVPFFYPPTWWSRSSLVSLCFLYGTAMQNWVLLQEMECECTQWILSCCAIYWWWPMYVCPPLPLHHHSAHELNILSCELAACLPQLETFLLSLPVPLSCSASDRFTRLLHSCHWCWDWSSSGSSYWCTRVCYIMCLSFRIISELFIYIISALENVIW